MNTVEKNQAHDDRSILNEDDAAQNHKTNLSLRRSAMKQGDLVTNIAITLQNPGEEMAYLTLNVGQQANEMLSLSLQDARTLAYTLIQHVHLAEVRKSLKRAAKAVIRA